MEDLLILRCWCEVKIGMIEKSIEKSRFMSRRRKRWMMAEVCGIQNVINRINLMIEVNKDPTKNI